MLEIGKNFYRNPVIQGNGNGVKKSPKEITLFDIQTSNDIPTTAELATAINTSPNFTVAENELPVFTIDNTKTPPQ
ncbi:hypothetical protein [uncultured Aquimarina sp.]|uniref:hypothetical protein n=1 Tax=uncultured Aquimarina sp. TaxID=575652 RepID=UPI0026308EFA|nr:hypothetical protein [uncultured Aquimarina sp.]